MALCTITGSVRSISGAEAAGITLTFERLTLTGQDDIAVGPGMTSVAADHTGQISVALYSGTYRLSTLVPASGTTPARRIVTALAVPDQDSAVLSDILNQTPTLTPSLVAQARAYRDEAAGLYQQTADMLDQGLRGPSAYEVAVAAGFSGTEAEWLSSLVGSPGDPGQSVTILTYTDDEAYNAAVTANAANPLALVMRYAQP